MRRIASLLAGVALVASLSACTSDNFYRGRVEAAGGASAQAFRVKDGVETPVTNRYVVQGQGTATVQTVKPYLTLDGSWAPDIAPGVAGAREEPGAVVMRGAGAPAAAKPAACPPCSGGSCALPGAAAPNRCGQPVYRGCDGTPGGTRVNNPSTRIPEVAPGTGWPCGKNPPPGVVGMVGIPAAVAAHVGVCFVNFLRCVFGF